MFLNNSERKGKGKQNLCFSCDSLILFVVFITYYHSMPSEVVSISAIFIYLALVLFEIMRSKMLFIVFCRIDYFYNEFMFFAKLWFLEY